MKSKIKIVLPMIVAFLLLSCTQNDVEVHSNDYVYNGRGGIKCEVNGVLLKPTTAILYENAYVDFDSTINRMAIGFHNSSTSTGLGYQTVRMIAFEADYTKDLTGNTFILQGETSEDNSGNYILEETQNSFKTNNIVTGEIKILHHNVASRIIGGTFWFDAVNSNGEIVKVRNGQFDLLN